MPDLCLGTAQFGMDYGVNNKSGKVKIAEVQNILDLFYETGNYNLDTAAGYGNAEKILGSISGSDRFCITTKIPSFKGCELKIVSELDKVLDASRCSLNKDTLDTVLLHDSSDLTGENGRMILKWLSRIKKDCRARKVGVSIYDSEDLEHICLDSIDVVQLPLSVFNQELMKKGVICRLKERGVEVHVRSVFLQGLLLCRSAELPDWLSVDFRAHHNRWSSMVKSTGKTQLETALAFIQANDMINTVVVGVDSVKHLGELIGSWETCASVPQHLVGQEWDWARRSEVDPRRWPR